MHAQFEFARLEAAPAGFDVPNFQFLTMLLFRAPGASAQRALNPLQPLQSQVPRTQAQHDALHRRMRSMGRALNGAPGNIARHFHRGGAGHGRDGAQMARDNFFTREGRNYQSVRGNAPGGHWGDAGGQRAPPTARARAVHRADLPPAGATAVKSRDRHLQNESYGAMAQTPPAPPTATTLSVQVQIPISPTGTRDLDRTDLADLSAESEQARRLFWLMQRAKCRWRRFVKKKVARRVRRGIRRALRREGKGNGGRGHRFLHLAVG